MPPALTTGALPMGRGEAPGPQNLKSFRTSEAHPAHLTAAVVHAACVGAAHPYRLQSGGQLASVQRPVAVRVQRIESGSQPCFPRPHETLEAVESAVDNDELSN